MLAQAAANRNGTASFDRRYENGLDEVAERAEALLGAGYLDAVLPHTSSRDGRIDKVVIQISDAGREVLAEHG